MGIEAGELGEVQPIDPQTGLIDIRFQFLDGEPGATLNYGPITPVTPLDAFKPPQQIQFWLGVKNVLVTDPQLGDNFIDALNLKLWWLRPNKEFRGPGTPTSSPQLEIPPNSGWAPIDQKTFLAGPNAGVFNNRYCWVPSVKRLDTTPYDSAPLPVPEQPNSFSELQDDVIRLWLPDPTDPAVIAAFPKPQIISRWVTFWYPAQGNALGLTWSAEYDNPAFKIVPEISLTWRTGAWGGATYTENEG